MMWFLAGAAAAAVTLAVTLRRTTGSSPIGVLAMLWQFPHSVYCDELDDVDTWRRRSAYRAWGRHVDRTWQALEAVKRHEHDVARPVTGPGDMPASEFTSAEIAEALRVRAELREAVAAGIEISVEDLFGRRPPRD